MKSIIATFALVFTALNAHAEQPTYQGAPTEFQQIERMYASGHATKMAEIPPTGWKTGRCFEAGRPSQPVAAALLKFEMDDKGPAFPATVKLAPLVWPSSVPSTYFDTIDRAKSKQADDYLYTYQNVWGEVSTASDALQIPLYDLSNGAEINRFFLRTGARYVVALSQCTSQSSCYSRETGAVYRTGQTIYACYFFKDVK